MIARHRRRRGGAGHHGRRRPCRGHLVRQWRAHRQCRCDHFGEEHVQPGHRSGPGLFRHRRAGEGGGTLQPIACASAPSLCGASWSSPPFPGRIRMRSTKASRKCRPAIPRNGPSPICPSIPPIWAAAMKAVIRINSQSGKGGVAYILEQDHGLSLPRGLQVEFSKIVQAATDRHGGGDERRARIWETFSAEYLNHDGPVGFRRSSHRPRTAARRVGWTPHCASTARCAVSKAMAPAPSMPMSMRSARGHRDRLHRGRLSRTRGRQRRRCDGGRLCRSAHQG